MTLSIHDWRLLSSACSFYEGAGYTYVETPWYVGQEAIRSTLPADRHGYSLGHPEYSPGHLVGSAEQAFVQLLIDGKLGPGKHFSMGPCFRDEHEDELHQRSFFKVELIEVEGSITPLEVGNVRRMMYCARRFFEENTFYEDRIYQSATEEGFDLELRGIEIGSYGLRQHGSHRWVYGTGLALPRFTKARLRDQ